MRILSYGSDFNPRSPWGERLGGWYSHKQRQLFQSTLPVGGATSDCCKRHQRGRSISIHAPRGGSDQNCAGCKQRIQDFNPRSPWGERHGTEKVTFRVKIISIHAPRGGSDYIPPVLHLFQDRFQSTLPVGGATLKLFLMLSHIWQFQSTLPVGGATKIITFVSHVLGISIHAPRGGSDAEWDNFCKRILISIHAPRGGSDF